MDQQKRKLQLNKKKNKRIQKMKRRIRLIKSHYLKDPLNINDPYVKINKSYKISNKIIDMRNLCSPIKNQYTIGSCSAFSVLASLEMENNNNVYSEMFLYYITRTSPKEHGGKNVSPDKLIGINTRSTLKILSTYGCCKEESWNYKKENIFKNPSNEAYNEANNYKIDGYGRVDYKGLDLSIVLNNMKVLLEANIPIICTFKMPITIKSEKTKKSGILDFAWFTKYYHSVLLVGYNDEIEHNGKKGCFIFKNSWGLEWGDNGFGYMLYEYVIKKKCADIWIIKSKNLDSCNYIKLIN